MNNPAIINADGASYDGKSYGCFDYQGVYNVNDSIDAYNFRSSKSMVEVNQYFIYQSVQIVGSE